MTTQAVFSFVDNNDSRAQVTLHLPGDAINNASVSLALTLASALQGVSSARLVSVKLIRKLDNPSATGPQLTSNSLRTGTLFYRNGSNTSSLSLPSISLLLAELSGPYAGGRITRDSLDLLGLLALVDGIPSGALDPAGREYGSVFSVGSIQGA